MLREDARVAMPPNPFWFNGREAIVQSLIAGLRDTGEWRLVPVRANRQPAAASYLRTWGGAVSVAFKIDILRIENGRVAEITPATPPCSRPSAYRRPSSHEPATSRRSATLECSCQATAFVSGVTLLRDEPVSNAQARRPRT